MKAGFETHNKVLDEFSMANAWSLERTAELFSRATLKKKKKNEISSTSKYT